MSTFTLTISCLTTSNLPWFMDLTFQVPMQYCYLQNRTLLPSPVTSKTGCCFCFGSISSFFLELFLHWSPVAYCVCVCVCVCVCMPKIYTSLFLESTFLVSYLQHPLYVHLATICWGSVLYKAYSWNKPVCTDRVPDFMKFIQIFLILLITF